MSEETPGAYHEVSGFQRHVAEIRGIDAFEPVAPEFTPGDGIPGYVCSSELLKAVAEQQLAAHSRNAGRRRGNKINVPLHLPAQSVDRLHRVHAEDCRKYNGVAARRYLIDGGRQVIDGIFPKKPRHICGAHLGGALPKPSQLRNVDVRRHAFRAAPLQTVGKEAGIKIQIAAHVHQRHLLPWNPVWGLEHHIIVKCKPRRFHVTHRCEAIVITFGIAVDGHFDAFEQAGNLP